MFLLDIAKLHKYSGTAKDASASSVATAGEHRGYLHL